MEITDEQREMIIRAQRKHKGARYALRAILLPEQYVIAQYMYGGDESLTDLKERLQQANFDIEFENDDFAKQAKLPENWFSKESDEFLKQCIKIIEDATETVNRVVKERNKKANNPKATNIQENRTSNFVGRNRTFEDISKVIEKRNVTNSVNQMGIHTKGVVQTGISTQNSSKSNLDLPDMMLSQIKREYELGTINIEKIKENIETISNKILLNKNASTYIEFFASKLLENNDPLDTISFITSVDKAISNSTTIAHNKKTEEAIDSIKKQANDAIIQMNRDWVKEKIKNCASTETIINEFADLPSEQRSLCGLSMLVRMIKEERNPKEK